MAKVAVLIDYFLPGFAGGGTPVSLSRIAEHAVNSGHEIRIITRDRDLGAAEAYGDLSPRTWQSWRGADIAYLRPGFRDVPWLTRQMVRWQPDVYYFNSLQSPWFTLIPLCLIRLGVFPDATIMLAPRGECSVGAFQHKRWKKVLVRVPIRSLLRKQATWHASTSLELKDITSWNAGRIPVTHTSVILADPPPSPAGAVTDGSSGCTTRIVFASRIDQMKGLDLALDIMQVFQQPCRFEVFGVISDDSYWSRCLAKAERLPPQINFTYRGQFRPGDSADIFAKSDLFLFPTRGENFGHVIAESLAAGCPVAISDKTMWTDLVNNGCGVAGSKSDIQGFLRSFFALSPQERRRLREGTHEKYVAWFRDNSQSGDLFAMALERV